MNLQTVLQDSAFSGLSAEQALAYGNETVVVAEDASRWSYAGVAQRFGTVAGEAIGAAMQAAGLNIAAMTYASFGIALNDPQTQVQLAAIATSQAGTSVVDNDKTLADVCHELMAIGITYDTRWQKWGLPRPTLADITAALSQNDVESRWITIWNEIVQPGIAAKKPFDQILSEVAGA